MNPNPPLPEDEAAAYLNRPVRTLQDWRHRGAGPRFLKMGRRVLYRRADLDAYIESCVRTSTSDPGPANAGAR